MTHTFYGKHPFAAPNPIIVEEENGMLASLARASRSSPNAQVLGRNGEIPLRDFFDRYLPYTLRAATGHVVSPTGSVSPQLDVMILDARYPLLAQNSDGSVLAMLHALVWAIEVKTSLRSRDMRQLWRTASMLASLSEEIDGYAEHSSGVRSAGFAYHLGQALKATINSYHQALSAHKCQLSLTVLRLPERDQPHERILGVEFAVGYLVGATQPRTSTTRLSQTPLSDLYYDVVRWGYHALHRRSWTAGDISEQIRKYMNSTSYSWSDYERDMNIGE